MKILVYACHFTPDPIGVGKFSGEMAEWLAAQGHEVRAVVAAPFYPYWKIVSGYSGFRYRREKVRGVDVMRCPVFVPQRQSGLARLLQYASFAASSTFVLLAWAAIWRPAIVWTVMPPLAGMPTALVAARIAGAPSWLHVQDFEVDAAFELNLLRSQKLRRLFLAIERRLMSAYSMVSTITPRMVDRLVQKQVSARKSLFPNWVDLEKIHPLPNADSMRDALNIPRNAFIALYSGNLGEKQGVDDLVEVARQMADMPSFQLVICGDGAGRARLKPLAADLGNIRFLPLQPIESFNEFLGMADVHLLPQKTEVADLVMPSKLPGMLASGRPVIVGAQDGTQLAKEVEGCGIVVPPGQPAAMAAAVRRLIVQPQERAVLGSHAAERAAEHWSKDRILARFEGVLTALARGCERDA